MAASYINGNNFSVDFMLWPKDISSYFWNTYIFYRTQSFLGIRFGAFIRNALISLFCTLLLVLVANVLKIGNAYYPFFFFAFLMTYATYEEYLKTFDNSKQLVGKHFTYSLKTTHMTIRDNNENQEYVIPREDIESIVEKNDMLIIFTRTVEYVLPKRVLTRNQVQSVLTFLP